MPTKSVFAKEYIVVTRSTNREDQRIRYDSADAHRERPTSNTSTATPEYNAMSEYAVALEEQVTALQIAADDESATAGHTFVGELSASATTIHSEHSTLIEELRFELKGQAAHMKRLAALVNYLAGKSDGPPKRQPYIGATAATAIIERLVLENCKKAWVTHDDDKFMDLEKNADKRFSSWKSCLK